MKKWRFPGIFTAMLLSLVLAGCGDSSSGSSSGSSSMPTAQDAIAPAKVVLTAISTAQEQINLTWTDPADSDLDHVEITCTDGTTTNTVSVAGGVQSCSLTGLDAGTDYTITVSAVDSSGNVSEDHTLTVSTTSGIAIDLLLIYTADDLNAVRGGVAGYDGWGLDKNYLVMADIDLAGYDGGDGNGWMPIGDDFTFFTGIFIGNDHVITNLTINRPDADYQGLFGYIGSGGRVENLGLEDNAVTGE